MTFAKELFAEKNVVVIGGTSGIGAATAEAFANLGAATHVAGLGAYSKEAPKGSVSTEIDVRSPADLEAYIGNFDRIDVLVNCAGVSRDRSEWTAQAFAEVMSINLFSVMTASRAARPLMPDGGSIINIASMYSTFGAADRPAYASSKGAVVQLTKSLAQEFAPNIRVNAVAPGWIVTPLSRNLISDGEASGPILARIPFDRWGEPKEVAEPIVYLASPAAGYITGVVVPVDGGYLTV
ncbi:NAD(P)-dependent dehydrogenase (short-subunit alcohol dehydrogenase family) [Rhizobium sp. SG_E_25_P2]|jgi:NAD(P)-dependent dehydrogenase (short-subunit alcohol dehydrogenase family)|uniref:SDR family NAD(P)-dependent oxidoreductase n=1 Tax=Rhizobium sp. SG_E_25_P2 TaxID=2879942 RepID=UPI002473FD7D|nr:SDR family oxidoreductase [Rhizobium sp. SG_E_25_P2]MDH6266026.1 NAD(P)-dependent dehydrogenase (short-subunit alcohol dehydrogenase family) [Rhizobium sp. SG_E_25_P2]